MYSSLMESSSMSTNYNSHLASANGPSSPFMPAHGQAPGPVYTPQPRKGMQFHMQSVVSLVLVPWVIFVLVNLSTGLLTSKVNWLALSVTILCITFSLVSVGVHFTTGTGRWYLYAGILGLIAVIAGRVTGAIIDDTCMYQYWNYYRRPNYSNVMPSLPAAAHEDGNRIIFSEGSALNLDFASGMLAKDGYQYCVAPVLEISTANGTAAGTSPGGPRAPAGTMANFWAVGVNCCGARRNFNCDDAGSKGVRTGVVLHHRGSAMVEYMYEQYHHAAIMGAAAYGLQLPKKPVFVRWVVNAASVQQSRMQRGLLLCFFSCVVYLVISFVVAASLHLSSATPQRKSDAIRYP